ncbi:T9SS C-terminal target domain-containing protein [Sphingobacteriales bacterium UPWRP_1]|nr:hypothetical protein BVG80_15610 [Sphingobacteriales bacterium TSM_CSM]PSJ76444.1 T9SS C-terminal target domain-containing protein [Sphingobacteriales bacterium UPWRP_1]
MNTFVTKQGCYNLFCALCFLVGSFSAVQAQLIVEPGTPPDQMVEILTGGGVSVDNIELNCPAGAFGTFNGLASNIGIETGIMLATGPLEIAVGPDDAESAGQDNGGPGYPLLTDIAGNTTFNACVLEFDIVPQGNVLTFNYVFGSEEYNEYVCSGFNDVFAFFVSGINPAGPDYANTNVALIPGTDIPVAINSVNNGTVGSAGTPGGCISLDYPEYFVDNNGGLSVQYDGFTAVLTATVNVVPFETYHFILSIADAGDGVFDSGVFLEAGSFESLPEFSLSPPDAVLEGCTETTVTVFIDEPEETDVPVALTYGGTATSGLDYLPLPGVVTIPAGESSVSFTVTTLPDGFPDPFETIIITLAETGASTTITILEPDAPEVNLGEGGLICPGNVVTLNAANPGEVTYLWQDGSTGSTYTVTSAGNYAVTVTGQCGLVATGEVTFTTQPQLSVNLGPDVETCQPVTLNATTPDALSYLWNTGETTATITAAASGNYSVTVSNDCSTVSDEVQVTFGGGIFVELGENRTLCMEAVNVLDATNPDATAYLWSDGSTGATLTITQTGVYSVTVSGPCGTGTDEVCLVVESCNPGCSSMEITQVVDCATDVEFTYQVYASIAGGTPPYTVTGDYNGLVDEDNEVILLGLYDFGQFYSFDVTDANGCVRSVLGKPVCSTLPVTLTRFDGEALQTANLLWWHTAAEVNNAYFTLLRSANGINFTPVAQIAGAGNSSTGRYYQYEDRQPLQGNNYYRLQQTDFDGQTTIAGTILLNRSTAAAGIMPFTVAPNITRNELTVLFAAATPSNSNLLLFDTAGRLLQTLNLQEGQQTAVLQLQNYPAGMYLLRFASPSGMYSAKVVKE